MQLFYVFFFSNPTDWVSS